jgi:FlaG/FlaF family flagellin (archaellin)
MRTETQRTDCTDASDSAVVRTRAVAGALWSAERGVSHVLGVVLVLAIVLTGVVSIVGFGVTGLSDSTADVSDTTIERDLTGFAREVDSAAVHSDSAVGATTVELSLAEMAESQASLAVDGDAGRLSLSLENGSTRQELVNTSLGLVEYRNPRSESQIAYQSGLVLSAPDPQATPAVVRANEMSHRRAGSVESLTLHVVRLTGTVWVDRQLELSAGPADDLYPEVLVGADGGAQAEELVVRVDSTYSGGWELALREALPADRTTFSHSGTELEVVYDVPDEGLFLHAYRHDVTVGGE